MAPWYAFVIVVIIVVAYFLLSATAKQRRRESVAADFAKMPDFHANQVFTDVKGETAIGIDDRGRRIAIARRHAQPRTKFYSFAHIVSAEVLQDGATVGAVRKSGGAGGVAAERAAGPGPAAAEATPGPAPAEPSAGEAAPKAPAPAESLFGSTARTVAGTPVITPALGPLTRLEVRVVFEDPDDPGLLGRFYEGRAVEVQSVAGEKAFAGARTCLGALDVAVKRAGLPPRPAISGKGLGPSS